MENGKSANLHIYGKTTLYDKRIVTGKLVNLQFSIIGPYISECSENGKWKMKTEICQSTSLQENNLICSMDSDWKVLLPLSTFSRNCSMYFSVGIVWKYCCWPCPFEESTNQRDIWQHIREKSCFSSKRNVSSPFQLCKSTVIQPFTGD